MIHLSFAAIFRFGREALLGVGSGTSAPYQTRELFLVFLVAFAPDAVGALYGQHAGQDIPLFSWKTPIDGDLITLPVRVKGRDVDFFVDTGSTFTIYDAALRSELPRRARRLARINGRDIEVTIVFPEQVFLGTLRVTSDGVETELSTLRRASGRDVYGVLGMDFLGQFRLKLDPDNDIVSVYPSGGGESEDGCEELPITFDLNRPVVRCTIPGWGSESFLVDTGASGIASGMLSDSLVKRLSAQGVVTQSGIARKTYSFEGTPPTTLLKLEQLRCGGNQHEDLCMSTNPPGGKAALSMPFWARYVVSLDFPAKKMRLRPSRHFGLSDTLGRTGISVMLAGGRVTVDEVAPRSPAAKAGIEVGDHVLSINSQNVSALRLFEVRRIFAQPDKAVRVRVERRGESLDVEMHLADVGGGK